MNKTIYWMINLSSSAVIFTPTISQITQTNVHFANKTHDKFTNLKGTSGKILSMTVNDDNSVIYAGSDNGTVYFSKLGRDFREMVNYGKSKIVVMKTNANGTIWMVRETVDKKTKKPMIFIHKSNKHGGFEKYATIQAKHAYSLEFGQMGELYLGTNKGLYYSNKRSFKLDKKVAGQIFSLASNDNKLYIGNDQGTVFTYLKTSKNIIDQTKIDDNPITSLVTSSQSLIYAANQTNQIWVKNDQQNFEKFKKPLPFKATKLIVGEKSKLYVGGISNLIAKETQQQSFQIIDDLETAQQVISFCQTSLNRIYVGTESGGVFKSN